MSTLSDLIIRAEARADHGAIRRVNEEAFGGAVEADLIEGLRREGVVLLSAVAELDQRIVGHVLFSRMWIDASAGRVSAVALAPVAVSPQRQREGIGGRLIRHGLDTLSRAGERIVIVLGHPEYYPRFGFSHELTRFLESPFPREAYMAIELAPGALDGIRGRVKYAEAFGL